MSGLPEVCDLDKVEEIIVAYHESCGFGLLEQTIDLMSFFASFIEFMQESYPDCILTPDVVHEWSLRRSNRK